MSARRPRNDDSPSAQFEYFRHQLADSVVPFDVRADAGAEFRGRILSRDFGAVRVTSISNSLAEAFRTPKLIRRSDPELCKIDIQIHGHLVLGQSRREALLRRGDLSVIDLSRPLKVVSRPLQASGAESTTAVVMFPRSLLPLPPDALAQQTAVRVPGRDGTSALISSIVLQMARGLDDLEPATGLRLMTVVLDLLATMLAGRADRVSAVPPDTQQRALTYRIHAFIEERLGDRGLSPSMIAAAHFISLRYLYKLFDAQGTTVAAWIRDRRLERCRADLLNPALRTRSVGAIAARWGFASPEHFGRLFRAAYQLPPGAYRDLHLREPTRA